jgi:hypothetical protein
LCKTQNAGRKSALRIYDRRGQPPPTVIGFGAVSVEHGNNAAQPGVQYFENKTQFFFHNITRFSGRRPRKL